MSFAVVVRKSAVSVSFEQWFAITTNVVLPLFNSISRPKMSSLTHVSDSMAGNSFSYMKCF